MFLIFLNFTWRVVKKFFEISIVWQSKRVSLHVFWSWTCSNDLNETLEGTNETLCRINILLVIYLHDILLMDQVIKEILMNRDTLIFALWVKVFWQTWRSQYSNLFRLDNRHLTDDHFTDRGKSSKSNKTLSGVEPEFSSNTLKLTKLICLLSSTIQTVHLALIQYSYLQEL